MLSSLTLDNNRVLTSRGPLVALPGDEAVDSRSKTSDQGDLDPSEVEIFAVLPEGV